ncbi:MAG: SDR family NAD(P)-dependent oxidoreductase [Acidimicrobiales bacterium]
MGDAALSSASLRFDGRVAVVTGGGSGMGREHARLLASRGASVAIGDLAGADDVASEIASGGGDAIGVCVDISLEPQALIDAAVDAFGHVDVVVNNAGILRSHDVVETTDEVWDEVLGVNLRGAFLVTRAAWPVIAAQRYGRVVFTTSNSGLLGVAGSSAYAASKAGLWGLVRVLALEGAALGIQTNAVAPLAFTPMSAQSRAAPPSWRTGAGDAWAARLSPSLVSPVVAWLAHEQCDLNGEMLSVAGGRVARFFLGLTPGVVDDDLTVESVQEHQREILAEDGYEVLGSAGDENRRLYRRLMP